MLTKQLDNKPYLTLVDEYFTNGINKCDFEYHIVEKFNIYVPWMLF